MGAKTREFVGWVCAWGAALALVAGCEAFTNCEDARRCEIGGAAGGGGEGGSAAVPGAASGGMPSPSEEGGAPNCEPASEDEPGDGTDANCDGFDGDASRGLFVSPEGDDDADGSRGAPFATLERAVTAAIVAEKDVYACSGSYEQSLKIEGVAGPVRVFGGYDCADDWRGTDAFSEMKPDAGVPLEIRDSAGKIELSRIKFIAPDATTPGDSSIAGRILRSKDVRLSKVEFIAGAGAKGSDGAPALVYETAAPAGLNGTDAPLASTFDLTNCYTYDSACVARCKVGCSGIGCGICDTSSACRVLRSTTDCQNRYQLSRTIPGSPSGTTTQCATDEGATIAVSFVRGGSGGNGVRQPAVSAQPGAVGSASGGGIGASGVSATSGFGSLTLEGAYLSTNGGTRGRFGAVGSTLSLRGGAGGSSTYNQGDLLFGQIGGGGGTAGKPGCGGYPGEPGGGGGASIALVVVESSLTFDDGALVASAGGAGGTPSVGGPGQSGGSGGLGGYGSRNRTTRTGGTGSNGTRGGQGGPGGAGAGGPSIALAFAGAEPVLEEVRREVGSGGLGGTGVGGGADGAPGIAAEVHEVSLP